MASERLWGRTPSQLTCSPIYCYCRVQWQLPLDVDVPRAWSPRPPRLPRCTPLPASQNFLPVLPSVCLHPLLPVAPPIWPLVPLSSPFVPSPQLPTQPRPTEYASHFPPPVLSYSPSSLLDRIPSPASSIPSALNVKSNATFVSSPLQQTPHTLPNSPSSRLAAPSWTRLTSLPSISASYTASVSTPSFSMAQAPS